MRSRESKKTIHVQVLEVLKRVCHQISTLDDQELERIGVYDSLFLATKLGIVEIVTELIKTNPTLLDKVDKQDRNILSLAILSRQEKIFNFICERSGIANSLSHSKDIYQNNILHLAGISSPFSLEQGKMPGAALQMQRELQWFQEMEKIAPAYARAETNSKGLKPRELFTQEHKILVKEGEKWMKDAANSCMVVATLIATFTFAAAFTVPGGFHQVSGYPLFLRHKLFYLFILSDALSLFSSSTSVLMFLSIYTSRYEEEDFLKALPKRLIIGLSSLFFSILTMMVTFCATMFLILTKKHRWIAIPITCLAGVPVTFFVLLQFPLFLDMFWSTYGPGLFKKPKDIRPNDLGPSPSNPQDPGPSHLRPSCPQDPGPSQYREPIRI
ncbi:ankyrin repeat-containing protein ITN1-like [Telopea speciosissima]|uniref:ankyrin repeat-containing protein ITN1-like n=1 Tax=Telopea speciosissima TaxID=54955 RepID=UPI001CC7F7C0|nr:ankyrin repeat-containing protein ITN1-like [Telopea speciosissima]